MPRCDTSGIACPQVMPARYPIVAEWTSSNPSIAFIIDEVSGCTATICPVIKGISNGTADIKAAYKSPSGTFLTATAKVTVGSVSSVPSITVLSPNGGEMWEAGQNYEIKWKQSQSASVSESD